jgi:protocatechuate 3,4-dioxygenase, alpha subunit
MTERPAPIATGSQTVGPFFHVGPAATDRLGRMVDAATPGEHIVLAIQVIDGDGVAVPDALVELWQADAAGHYAPTPAPDAEPPAFSGFGRLGTDANGWCRFETIRPGAVDDDGAARQAPHVNVCVFARGLLRHLYTRIYFEGDPTLGDDPLLAIVPSGRRATLVARPGGEPGVWQFTIRLQGDGETVFFDV